MNKFIFLLTTCLFFGTSILYAEDKPAHKDDNEKNFVEISKEKTSSSKINISEATKGKFVQQIFFPGEIAINGDLLIHVTPRFEGTLKRVVKQIGEAVKKGDLLATVQSNNSLSTYEIIAESDGVVIDKDASVGEFVTSNKSIFTIANFDTVWVNVAIHAHDLHLIKKNTSVTVISKEINISQDGVVEYIRPTLSETTRTALARIVLDNSNSKWLPGMFVSIGLITKSDSPNLLIPSESAVFINNEYVAFIESSSPDGEYGFEIREIKIGRNNQKEVEVISGLKIGDRVASGETFILKAELGKGSAEHAH